MIIRDKPTGGVSSLYSRPLKPDEKVKPGATPASRSSASRDEIEISAEALALCRAAGAGEDVRWDRVAELREQIQQGRYEIPLAKLAQRMLGDV